MRDVRNSPEYSAESRDIELFRLMEVHDKLDIEVQRQHEIYMKQFVESLKLDEINAVINRLINHPDYLSRKEKLSQFVRETETELSAFRQEIREAKRRREERRRQSPSEEELAAMIRESQFQKAELKRRERKAKEAIHNFQQDFRNRFSVQHIVFRLIHVHSPVSDMH